VRSGEDIVYFCREGCRAEYLARHEDAVPAD
jgi:hypothetical protein